MTPMPQEGVCGDPWRSAHSLFWSSYHTLYHLYCIETLFKKVWTGAYYSIMVVRHPFDRLLSAYRDRIMNKETGQAKNHIPRIFVALKVGINFLSNLYDFKMACFLIICCNVF